MNLLNEPWMPVRRRDGSREWIAPHQVSDPDVVAFDADRPDFNGALSQFAIGLLQTTTPMDNPMAWKQLFANPPDAATLQRWFAPVTTAFDLDGDGARFMQDIGLKNGGGKTQVIAGLLIETPGNNALKNNSDHFVKRGTLDAMCDRCTAAALFTLQTNSPEGGGGGGGKFTGIRGGGPLTTLVVCQPRQSLWQDLWLNVRERSVFLSLPGDSSRSNLPATFPWLETQSLPMGDHRLLTPVQMHPAHVFWAMPRRIRVDFATIQQGICGICQECSSRIVVNYSDATGGFNYKEKGLWDHPLSPYVEQAHAGWQPVHPRGPIGYRHWLAWVAGNEGKSQRPAKVVNWCVELRHRVLRGHPHVWAFGYDMDSAKPQCWYESTVPLYGLVDCDRDAQRRVEASVGDWLAGADLAARYLINAVKDAWFGDKAGKARGDFTVITASFWSRTEPDFYRQLKGLIETLVEAGDCVHQRPGIVHYLFDYSPDMEYLEVVAPADFTTVEVAQGPPPFPTPRLGGERAAAYAVRVVMGAQPGDLPIQLAETRSTGSHNNGAGSTPNHRYLRGMRRSPLSSSHGLSLGVR